MIGGIAKKKIKSKLLDKAKGKGVDLETLMTARIETDLENLISKIVDEHGVKLVTLLIADLNTVDWMAMLTPTIEDSATALIQSILDDLGLRTLLALGLSVKG